MFKKLIIPTLILAIVAINFSFPKTSFAAFGDYTGTSFDTGASGNTYPVGITALDDFLYVMSGSPVIYKHDLNGTYTGTSFDLSSVLFCSEGITEYDGFFWIVDSCDGNEVHKYNIDGTAAGFSFDTTPSGSSDPIGITSYDGFLWIIDRTSDEVYKYQPDGTYTTVHFDTAGAGVNDPVGITYYNNSFLIADSVDDKVYIFDTDGVYTNSFINLAPSGNTDALDITAYNNYFWVTDNTDREVYKYEGDIVAPIISETTPVVNPSMNVSPSYTFTTDEAGTISYGGSCTSVNVSAEIGANIITFSTLEPGTYTDCTITVTDAVDNASNILTVTSFTITAPPSHGSSGSRPKAKTNIINELPIPILTPSIPGLSTECLSGDKFSNITGLPCPASIQVNTVNESPDKFIFTKSLWSGVVDNEVKELQKYLNTHGYPVALSGPGSIGNETTKFGGLTKAALIKFQIANKISPAVGFFGPITRGVVNGN